MTRWLERLAGLAVACLLTWPLILLLVQYPTLIPIGIAAVGAFLVGGYVGYGIGRAGADHQWRLLFVKLGVDHGHEVQELTDQLARADKTIDMLRRNDGVAFMAGQVMRQDWEANGL